MSEADPIGDELRKQATRGMSAVEIARWLRGELGPDAAFFAIRKLSLRGV